ncbi:MAG TPA: hypothetical protein VF885_00290 [Arthrobacter sp.]
MGRSILLDRGKSQMLIYPEVVVVNARGDRVRVPSETPVEVWVTISAQRQGDGELAGQVSLKTIRCITRSAPVGSWARIVFRGEEWDLMAPPHFTDGLSRATRHVEFIIRSRNRLDEPNA